MSERGIEEADMRALVRLLGEVAAIPGGLLARKCYLLDGLCDFAGASEWRWALFAPPRHATCLAALRRKLHGTTQPVLSLDQGHLQPVHERHLPPAAPSSHVLLSRRTLDPRTESRIALCREKCGPPFSPRESHLTSLVLDEIPWLHWREWKPRAAASRLAPRHQLTLDLLLLGLGGKEIAVRIGISPGTVSSYIRELFRRFGVNSQTELMHKYSRQTIAR